ncbi:membrane complex biogenesis BtpA family protein [Labrys monachus]|uniref:Membrane complex biogenesis BtpA family protein n=1 Tax=Labrys monachus TaxID=217067 RepID=A0ABU0FID0_9HYPH|nr:membrane complex biogenesis BtpA family protein [Labrys monachus]
MVHCPAFPGAPGFEGGPVEPVYDRALRDAEAYVRGGIDGLIIENHGDIPFLKPGEIGPETAAAMAVVTERVRRAFDVPIGINVLANAAIPALAVAKAAGAAFVRVNQWANAYVANEGFIEGEAARVLRYRAAIGAKDVMIFADTHVKHGAHAIVADRSVAELTRDVEFFGADAVIATGQRTGDPVDFDELAMIGRSTGLALLVGSGVTDGNIEGIFRHADGVIIGSFLKAGGVWWDPVDQAKVSAFMRQVAALRA